jgi:hypothetical protein
VQLAVVFKSVFPEFAQPSAGSSGPAFPPGISPLETSITAIFLENPICGAASPTPLAAYMDSNMSSRNWWSSAVSKSRTSSASRSSTGLPNFTIG